MLRRDPKKLVLHVRNAAVDDLLEGAIVARHALETTFLDMVVWFLFLAMITSLLFPPRIITGGTICNRYCAKLAD